ncbi:uncharacterized protein LOC112349940 [Selaginella moellendorffii]|uniref:uncharacterized protein LOC112349940 n=1 Tax=Selaginella moellendorffii TaxID=88036 RepID=UPI000D1C4FEE|nr:uncharacterized protein LOC112349940 [Selaginella moellendorffii]|eukprot:XP_024541007.1 uncharacterized protein LOC112349940 [Selaginella moellendorffii]
MTFYGNVGPRVGQEQSTSKAMVLFVLVFLRSFFHHDVTSKNLHRVECSGLMESTNQRSIPLRGAACSSLGSRAITPAAMLLGSADAARGRNQLQSLTRIGGAQSGKHHLQARSRNREKLLSIEKRLLPKTAASLSGRNHIRNLSARRTLELLELAPPAVPSESKRLVPTGPDPLHHSTRTETLHPRQPLA